MVSPNKSTTLQISIHFGVLQALLRGARGEHGTTEVAEAARRARIIRTLRPFPPARAPQVLRSEVRFEV